MQTTDRRDNTSVILIATITPTLLALVIMTILVHICLCKKISNKQTQLQAEDQQENYTPLLSSNSAYGTNVAIAPEIDCEVNVAYEQRDPNVECRSTMQLSSNPAYGTNVAIAPEIDCEENLAYKQEYNTYK